MILDKFFLKYEKTTLKKPSLIRVKTIPLSTTKALANNLLMRRVLMKEQPRTKVKHFRNSNFKHKMKRLQIPQKLVQEKFYDKILRTRNCRRKFMKNLYPEKRKENIYLIGEKKLGIKLTGLNC